MNEAWILGFAGGLMIGGAATLFLLLNGRIMGASGILGGLVDGSGRRNWAERAVFIAGLIGTPVVAVTVFGTPDTHLTSSLPVLIAAGLCVGLGTRLANGCTSGHGVCGISRLSVRGLVATVIYLLAGAVTVLVFRHLLELI